MSDPSSKLDYFQRQRAVPGWNDDVIASQVALVLGTGGIGCTVLMCLCRLGIREVITLDRDTVDATNLNRQLLFTVSQVGMPKVAAAKQTLEGMQMRTKVTAIQCDVIKEWKDVVLPYFNVATVVFNAIDWGGSFHTVVNSVCFSRGIPYASASSYAHNAIAESYAYNQFASKQTSPDGERPVDTDGCFGCSIARPPATLARWMVCSGGEGKEAEEGRGEEGRGEEREGEKRGGEEGGGEVKGSLIFLPRDAVPATGAIGSSVLPCSTAGEMCVNMWINGMFGGKDSQPNQAMLNLAAMELATFKTAKDAECCICGGPQALSLAGIKSLAFSSEPVLLGPANGTVSVFEPREHAKEFHRIKIEQRFRELQSKHTSGELTPQVGLPRLSALTEDIYEPCVPTVDIPFDQYFEPLSALHLKAGAASRRKVPYVCAKPLVKLPEGAVHAVRSGLRSAITFEGDSAIRLKGCSCFILMSASEQAAFPIVPMEYHEAGGRHMRGCQFEQTAVREQLFCHRIAALTEEHGVFLGNMPIGVARYEMKDDIPAIPKFCGYFHTAGDRRLQTHLLGGLEMLIASLVGLENIDQSLHGLLTALFPACRIMTDTAHGAPVIEATFSACLLPQSKCSFVDLHEIELPECTAGLVGLSSHVPVHWKPLWHETCVALQAVLDAKCCKSSVVAHTYARLGYEVGLFQRTLKDGKISWGYFYDHWLAEPHNNAHPNNFVVAASTLALGGLTGVDTKVGDFAPQVLAAVDFDMSFGSEEFINNFTGLPDDEQFEEYIKCEVQEMRRVLGGDEASNSGIALQGSLEKLQAKVLAGKQAVVQPLKWALRDTLQLGWEAGWDAGAKRGGVGRQLVADSHLERGMQLLIRLALMLTDGVNS